LAKPAPAPAAPAADEKGDAGMSKEEKALAMA